MSGLSKLIISYTLSIRENSYLYSNLKYLFFKESSQQCENIMPVLFLIYKAVLPTINSKGTDVLSL